MKKSSFITAITFAFLMLLTTNVNAQKFSGMDKSPLDIAYMKTDRSAPPIVKVIYSRPQLKGRALSKLAPNGKVWRTGANESTEIIFLEDVKMGGETIKAGTYSLFTIPGEKQWTIILSSDRDGWGSMGYKEANDVARFIVDASTSEESLEAFSITFDGTGMHLGWGNIRVAVPIAKM